MKLKNLCNLLVIACVALIPAALAQEAPPPQTFTVQNGSKPWYDRDAWVLAQVPDSLKSATPVAQQNCSSRSLDITGSPASITLAVFEKDVDTFTTRNPAAQLTKDTLTVVSTGTPPITLKYLVFTLAQPPAHIDGSGFNAGMILLKTAAK